MALNKTTAALAAIVAVLLVGIGGLIGYILNSDEPEVAAAPVTAIVTTTAPPATTPEMFLPPPPPPAPVEPMGSTVVQGGPCLESEVRNFGTDTNGRSLVCIYMGGGGFSWVTHADNSGAVETIGEPCDPTADRVAQDAHGLAIMCGGQTWVAGP